eukprot:gnl/Spiro4/29527_TR14454_c0_g1_i1.p1 gnl/Spiro4/29527_TR14454_c0_g1~~gnl/Spiro4/29527_TR14454_c0_g1_i1.p1  ORF type:complete len:457 (+),score=104.69 gnl/Spiro4/29527_TR14454_c0_g1_i1:49-1419(+)
MPLSLDAQFHQSSTTSPNNNVSVWATGVAINLCGSVLINLGTNLLKYSHRTDAGGFEQVNDTPSPPRRHSRRMLRIWAFGLALFVLGSVLNFVSFAFAAQSLLAALGSVQFISNVVFGSVVLGERVTMRTAWATLLIVLGSICVVLHSSHSDGGYTVEQMIQLYAELPYRVYLIVLAVLYIFLEFGYRYLKARMRAKLEQSDRDGLWLGLMFAAQSAILGTQSVLQAKCLSSLLRQTVAGHNQLTSLFAAGVTVAWLVCMMFWVYRMNRALALFDGLFIIPVLQVFWTLLSIVGGLLYFQEYRGFDHLQSFMFCTGILLGFAGVYLLFPSAESSEPLLPEAVAVGRKRASSIASMSDQGVQTESRMRSLSMGLALPVPSMEDHINMLAEHHDLMLSYWSRLVGTSSGSNRSLVDVAEEEKSSELEPINASSALANGKWRYKCSDADLVSGLDLRDV